MSDTNRCTSLGGRPRFFFSPEERLPLGRPRLGLMPKSSDMMLDMTLEARLSDLLDLRLELFPAEVVLDGVLGSAVALISATMSSSVFLN
jgi:hypothetical protein